LIGIYEVVGYDVPSLWKANLKSQKKNLKLKSKKTIAKYFTYRHIPNEIWYKNSSIEAWADYIDCDLNQVDLEENPLCS
jgi:hypothetical protein